jgi:pimeloyl-ACP methyl ester carboxylesterase
MSYADVNGLSLYYDEIGEGDLLIALHGGIGAGVQLTPLARALAPGRRVVVVDLQGHGHTADIDRPLRHELMADDVAALIDHLGAEQADVLGYSLGGEVALRTAIQHPDRVRRLVLISTGFRRDGSHPEVVAAFDAFGPGAAEFLAQGPLYELYTSLAPRPEDWPQLIAKTADLLHEDFDWGDEIGRVTAQPAARLAVLPGMTHYDVTDSPLLAPAVEAFLGAT